jgi:large subunit ribosomal protein L29
MKIKELRSTSKEDLKVKLKELRKELIKSNAQIATGTNPKSPGQVREMKKTIAKIMMVINEKPIAKDEKAPAKVEKTAAKETKAKAKAKKTEEA